MTQLPLPEWAKKHNISRRKAEYLAAARPDLITMIPKKIERLVHVKAIDESIEPDEILLRGKSERNKM